MANGSHFTLISLKVAKTFVVNRHRRRWNYEVASEVGGSVNTTHTILKDFENKGWLTGTYERNDGTLGRAARKLYGLTDAGAEALSAVLMPLQLASS